MNYQEQRFALKRAVKTFYDYQYTYNRIKNRLGLKKDNTQIDAPARIFEEEEFIFYEALIDSLSNDMKKMEKTIRKYLKEFSVWTEWLKGVKGVGETMGAVICSEFDIDKATTVSKMWQFAGLNPGEVRGKKTNSRGEIKITEELIRGDKLKSGFNAPFNQFLRCKLIGVLATSFIKSNSPYRKFYDDYKNRKINIGLKRGHAHNQALRYMIKMFLIDLYKNWRELEGLPVRPPYQEEYAERAKKGNYKQYQRASHQF